MAKSFFYGSILVIFIFSIFLCAKKRPDLAKIITGLASVTYSLTFDIIFGWLMGLYYYITPQTSMLYILISSFFIYAPLNVIYIMYLPSALKNKLIYSSVWIAVMLLFEYGSLAVRTIVFTGWNPIPWSVVTYVTTYLWINLLYSYLISKGLSRRTA